MTDRQPSGRTTALAADLIRRIRATGPISLADYMAACLADPKHGYYARHDPLGAKGDFVTAPEISQIFGELIGLWCLSAWLELGSPSRFVFAELGPGRGTLMADALRAAAIRPAFGEAAEIALVEINPDLRTAQRAALQGLAEPTWFDSANDLPPGPLIVVANEFFDALPIRQFMRTDEGWAERVVGIGDDNRLAFGLRPIIGSPKSSDGSTSAEVPLSPGGRGWREAPGEGATYEASAVPPHPNPLPGGERETGRRASEVPIPPVGTIFETCPAATAIVTQLVERIAAEGGAALVIDYGHAERGYGDTLQAVRAHQYDDALAHPGEADLTAHVDFAALADAAVKAGAAVPPVIDQAAFLARMGIAERAEALERGKDEGTAATIAAGVARLTGPDQMGHLFKVLAFSSPDLTPPGFDS